jgi:hypothetical protein
MLMLTPSLRAQPKSADELADAVMKANGADHWGKVKIIRWTFAGGRKHVWNLKEGTDVVTSKDGKSTTIKVGAMPTDPEEKKAYQAWTNDSYWLIAPLKIKDPGVMLSTQPDEKINGKNYLVLHLAFQGVGMTPGDQYNWYIDPETMMLSYWDYMPSASKKTRWSWEGYKDFNGIKIATEHKREGGSGPNMSDVSVEFE